MFDDPSDDEAPTGRESDSSNMSKTPGFAVMVLLTGMFLAMRLPDPASVAASVEIMPGVILESDLKPIRGLVSAFDRAEAAVEHADLDALMRFYAEDYNYHGLKRSDVRRVWEEVFSHYTQVTSKHVFSSVKLTSGKAQVTCTGELYGVDKQTGQPMILDAWVSEVHYLVNQDGAWRFFGNTRGASTSAPPTSAPHHPLF